MTILLLSTVGGGTFFGCSAALDEGSVTKTFDLRSVGGMFRVHPLREVQQAPIGNPKGAHMPRADESSVTYGPLLKRTARVGALMLKSRQFPLMCRTRIFVYPPRLASSGFPSDQLRHVREIQASFSEVVFWIAVVRSIGWFPLFRYLPI